MKHTPCTVCGWDLHAAERVRTTGSERLLSYMPKLIFLKFAEVKWHLHPDLEVGVFPLRPVTREWVVNDATGAKIVRRGFALVPDYASTGFMIQGATLPAEIAECGDLFAIPGLTEVLTTYVILSRVKRADALLLLRAFSPLLFGMGTPPGPACLLHLLRAWRESGYGSKMPGCSLTDAQLEYDQLSSQSDEQRKLQRAKGLEWCCCRCGCRYPAEGFGATTTNDDSVRDLCVAPGFWRICVACSSVVAQTSEQRDGTMSNNKRCTECSACRHMAYFVDNLDVCSVCTLRAGFELFVCGNCSKPTSMKKWSGRKDKNETKLCMICVPVAAFLDCSLCHEQLPIDAFSFKYRDAKHTFRRCNTCSIACSRCHEAMKDARAFATASSWCWKCERESKLFACAACVSLQDAEKFDSMILWNHKMYGRLLVCKTCTSKGYSPRDVATYACAGEHDCGHLQFNSMHLRDWTRRKGLLWCNDCYKQQGKCEGCQKHFTRDAFDQQVWHHHTSHHRKLICLKCEQRGCSLRDPKLYTCDKCKSAFGHAAFDRNDLKDSKRPNRTYSLLCIQCKRDVDKQKAIEAKRLEVERQAAKALAQRDKNRGARLLTLLRLKDSWRCTCKTILAGQRAHAALYNRLHKETCSLHRRQYGELRWDGKNKGVTLEDILFLHERKRC